MRLFVAIELDKGLRRAIARSCEQRPELERGVRPVGEEQLHLTVRFLGETSDDRIADVIAAAEDAAAAVPAFSFFVRGFGCFPKPHLAKVFWVGLEPSPPLETLARRVEAELRQRGFPPEPRGFSPHVTIGRAKGPPLRLREPFELEHPRFGEQQVDQLTVMESRPSPRGSTYVPVAHASLAEPAAPPSSP